MFTLAPPGLMVVVCMRGDPGLTPGANDVRPLRGLGGDAESGKREAESGKREAGSEKRRAESEEGRHEDTEARRGEGKKARKARRHTVERTLDRGTRSKTDGLQARPT
jgi:hypothetical protein